jgi:inorganic pyrophosphatase
VQTSAKSEQPTPRVHPIADPSTLPMRHNGLVVIVIETPSGSGNKLKFDEDLGVYRLERVLPAGMSFPFDFGFIPETLADDGDPLDAIVLLDSPLQAGCIVKARLIGVIEAEQQERGARSWQRNDRLVGVAGGSKGHAALRSLDDVDAFRLQAIESFFANYHALDGDRFRVVARRGIRAAEAAIRKAHHAYQAERKGAGKAAAASRT